MTPQDETKFEKKAEKMLRGYREFPNGRDFRCFKNRERTDFTDDFRVKYDKAFPDAPGSPGWFEKKFGKKKEREGLKVGVHVGGGFLGR